VTFVDLDDFEQRARELRDSGDREPMLVSPDTALELVRMLREAETLLGEKIVTEAERALGPTALAPVAGQGGSDPGVVHALGGCLEQEHGHCNPDFCEEAPGRNDPKACSCDESLALRARIGELDSAAARHAWALRDRDTMIENEHKLYRDAWEKFEAARAHSELWKRLARAWRRAFVPAPPPSAIYECIAEALYGAERGPLSEQQRAPLLRAAGAIYVLVRGDEARSRKASRG
jgi:hypothetical protein